MNKPDATCRVVVTWAESDGKAHSQQAIVLALNEKKIKLALREELSPLQPCTIALTNADGTPGDSVQATIHHVRRRDKDIQATCELAEPLSEANVHQLVLSHQHERRGAERQPVTIDARVRSELGTEALPIQVVDLSEGGCCIESPIEVAVGQKVQLIFWDEGGSVVSVVLRIRWQRPKGTGFLVGCQFVNPKQYATLLPLTGAKRGESLDSLGRQSLLKRAFYLAHTGMSLFRGAPVQESAGAANAARDPATTCD
jgi:PilZ domain